MYKFSLSVRAYYEGRRYGLPAVDDWSKITECAMRSACEEAAKGVLTNHRGKTAAVELLRAAGFGVFEIYARLHDYPLTLDKVKERCEKFDLTLHGPLY